LILLRSVAKAFRNRSDIVQAIDHIDLNIEPKQIFSLLGPNGAGKTTLIKLLCGLITPDSGQIMINGVDIGRQPHIAKQLIGVVLESAKNVYQYLTVRETLEYFGLLNGLAGAKLSKRICYLTEMFSLQEKISHKVGTLSRGMQQKLAIMIAMVKDPEILILDEPTLGLDVISSLKIRDVIKDLARGKTIILTTHALELAAELSDRIAIINKGRIVHHSTMPELVASYQVNEDSYRIVFRATSAEIESLNRRDPKVEVTELQDSLYQVKAGPEAASFLMRNFNIIELEKENADLESIFIDLLHKSTAQRRDA